MLFLSVILFFFECFHKKRSVIQQPLEENRNGFFAVPVPLQFTDILGYGSQPNSGLLHPSEGRFMSQPGCSADSVNNSIYFIALFQKIQGWKTETDLCP